MIYRIFVDIHLHASQHSLCLTIFYTTLPTEQLHSSVFRDAVHTHTSILIYVCDYYANLD